MTTHELAEQTKYVTSAGKFIAKVKQPGNGWLGKTKTGTDFIRLPLRIDDPASDQHGREIVWQGWLSEKAATRTAKTLDEAFGREWDISSLSSGKSPFLNQRCKITVEAEEYNGEARFKIKWINPLEGAAETLAPDRIADLNERLKIARNEEEISF